MRRWVAVIVLLLCLPLVAWGANTHGTPSEALERQAWFGDALAGYVVSGCLPGTSGTTTTATFACNAYVKASGTDLVYVTQPTKTVGPLSGGDGTYWIAVHRDVSTAVGGWTRQAGTHYLWQLAASQPAAPTNGLIIAQVIVASSTITQTVPVAARAPLPTIVEATSYGLSASASGAGNVAALQAAVGTDYADANSPHVPRIVRVPSGTYSVNAMVTIPPGVTIECTGANVRSASGYAGAIFIPTHDGVVFRFTKTITTSTGLWHQGGVRGCGFSGLGASATTASRFIELGDPANVDINHGAWIVTIADNLFMNSYGYAIYAAHSQEAHIHRNMTKYVKYPIYYNTVMASARILDNDLLDESDIPGAIAIQGRPGSFGGAAAMVIQRNYTIGFVYGVWLTSALGAVIRDNAFEGTQKTPITCDKYLSDGVTADQSGCWGIVVDGNTFINWSDDGVGASAIRLAFTANSYVGIQTYQAPNASATMGVELYDNGANTHCNNIIFWPFIHDNTAAPGGAHTSVPPMAVNNSLVQCQRLVGGPFEQPRGMAGDALSPTAAWGTSSWGDGESGRYWWDRTNKRFRVWYDGTIGAATIPSVLSGSASIDWGGTAANTCDTANVTITGAANGEEVVLGVPTAGVTAAGALYFAYISATDTVTIKRCNISGSALSDPSSMTMKVSVIKR